MRQTAPALRCLGATAMLAAAIGCGSSTTDEPDFDDARVTAPAPPPADKGMQFLMPETTIAPGAEVQLCWIPSWVPDKDYLIHDFVSYQGKGGHHIFALASSIPRQPGDLFDCTSLESMTSMQPLISVTEARTGDVVAGDLPDDFAVRLVKDTKIVIQSHYVNTGEKPILVRDVAEFYFYDQAKPVVEFSYFVLNDGAIDLPVGKSARRSHCEIDQEYQIKFMLGHMHNWGTSIRIERERAGQRTLIQEISPWRAEYRDTGPVANFDRNSPFMLVPGDRIHVECNYDNTTGKSMQFPKEMCVAFGGYFPARPGGFIACDTVID